MSLLLIYHLTKFLTAYFYLPSIVCINAYIVEYFGKFSMILITAKPSCHWCDFVLFGALKLTYDNYIYTVAKKVSYLIFDNNFRKCEPIFKIFSPVDF